MNNIKIKFETCKWFITNIEKQMSKLTANQGKAICPGGDL
jgi:hypothetical protein